MASEWSEQAQIRYSGDSSHEKTSQVTQMDLKSLPAVDSKEGPEIVDENPDGGLRAWLVILGVSAE
jgi:hypothetical protein